jgi:hypothetical protein
MLEIVTQFKALLDAHLPATAVPFVLFGLGVVAIFIVVQILDILFKLIKITVVAGLAIGLIYLLVRA